MNDKKNPQFELKNLNSPAKDHTIKVTVLAGENTIKLVFSQGDEDRVIYTVGVDYDEDALSLFLWDIDAMQTEDANVMEQLLLKRVSQA